MLMVTQLAGFGGGRSAPPPLITHVTSDQTTGAATTYTFNNQNIGAAAADRHVVVFAAWEQNSAVRTLSSATIGGAAATIDVQATGLDTTNRCGGAMFRRLVPAGTTANIVLTLSGSADQMVIAVYTITGHSTGVPSATSSSNTKLPGTSFSTSLNVGQNGCILAGLSAQSTNGSASWSSPLIDSGGGWSSGTFLSSAHANSHPGGVVACTWSDPGSFDYFACLVAATWSN
jgi:hypothetical protein